MAKVIKAGQEITIDYHGMIAYYHLYMHFLTFYLYQAQELVFNVVIYYNLIS